MNAPRKGTGDSVSQISRATDGLRMVEVALDVRVKAIRTVCAASGDAVEAKQTLGLLGLDRRDDLLAARTA